MVDDEYPSLRCLPDHRGASRCRNLSRNACNACTYTSRLLIVAVTYRAHRHVLHSCLSLSCEYARTPAALYSYRAGTASSLTGASSSVALLIYTAIGIRDEEEDSLPCRNLRAQVVIS